MVEAAVLTEHGYMLDGVCYPRVSSILQLIPKPGIAAWEAKIGKQAADEVRDIATRLGSRIHEATEAWDRDGVLPLDTDLVPHVDAYRQWVEAAVVEVVAIEETLVHPTMRYGGTLDRLYRLRDGRLVLGDIKSSKSLNGSYRLQLSAYELGLLEARGVQVEGRGIVWLPSNRPGVCRWVEYDDPTRDARAWRALVYCYWYGDRVGDALAGRARAYWGGWWKDHQHDWKATRG